MCVRERECVCVCCVVCVCVYDARESVSVSDVSVVSERV